jgi:leukotriene-A4 hydrolase
LTPFQEIVKIDSVMLLPLLLLAGCLILTDAAVATLGSTQDPSSYSNVDQFQPTHLSMDFAVRFEDSSTFGTITHTLTVLEADVTTVFMDTWDGVSVSNAAFSMASDTGYSDVPFAISTPNPNIGNALNISLPAEMAAGTQFYLKLTYATTDASWALDWMTPAQTAGKKHPFMYSLCQMNYCRDMAPMMDTPSQKITFDATVVAPSNLMVAMSGNETGKVTINDTHTSTTFECTIKIPAYLVSIVVGDLERRTVGRRIDVVAEPALLDAAVEEFSELVRIFEITEEYLTPYIWGNYSIFVMPPSFAWGGMEHPLMTLVSPTLVSGDKSQVTTATHEITHSWFGNNVGCANWDNFWLNEGINTFMERKVTSILRGLDYTKINYFTGNTSMYDDMVDYGLDNPYSSLYPNIRDDDPENSFSGIIYEKGSQFVYYLETLLGEEKMQALLRLYINTFAEQAITSDDFKQLYEQFVKDNFPNATEIISVTQWDVWITSPGLPPVTLDFRTDELEEAHSLARAYVTLAGASSPPNKSEFDGFFPAQKVAFVQELGGHDSVDAALMAYIDSDLDLTNIMDPRVKNRWFVLGIKKFYEPIMEPAHAWAAVQGRNAYIRPIFAAMVEAGKCDLATVWFEEQANFYNSYVMGSVRKALASCPDTTESSTGETAPAAPSDLESSATMVAPYVSGIAMILVAAAF